MNIYIYIVFLKKLNYAIALMNLSYHKENELGLFDRNTTTTIILQKAVTYYHAYVFNPNAEPNRGKHRA
jgi:hypothetical protein